MTSAGQAIIARPGFPASIDTTVTNAALTATPTSASSPWSEAFQYPAFRGMAGPSKVAVQMVLTLRDDRGQIVEMLHIPLVIKANWPSEIVHQINIDQSTIDLLAVMLTDRPPGAWDLEIDYPTNPHHEGGPIVSGLHRSSGDGVPSGCTPCRQEKT